MGTSIWPHPPDFIALLIMQKMLIYRKDGFGMSIDVLLTVHFQYTPQKAINE